ncbi:hypothetical protein CAPTEDRAFT_208574 [Capitella teleta]|uniref:Carboxypeptidase activation peptide domain-containing protein n=1 Tax=Capitella teleta TaxID=283909 RepID=R7TNE8_CAPTE|nr:hypothetical protein CAPTEDRAFT_208574 [Capitella teleta]|eukprot:ELT95373.1 hypothetical protein CAPTEDRAFT_208574 [Capitella teleta]
MRFIVLLSALAFAASEKVSYTGYHSILIPQVTSDEVSIVRSLADTDDRVRQVMLMNDHLVAGMEANLLVSPEQASYVMSILDQFEIPFDIVSSDFQSWIDEVDSLNEINKQKWIADFESGNKRKPDFYMTNSETRMSPLALFRSQCFHLCLFIA